MPTLHPAHVKSLNPEELIIQAEESMGKIIDESISKVFGDNRADTQKMRHLLRRVTTEGPEDVVKRLPKADYGLLGRSIAQFISIHSERLAGIKNRLRVLNDRVKEAHRQFQSMMKAAHHGRPKEDTESR